VSVFLSSAANDPALKCAGRECDPPVQCDLHPAASGPVPCAPRKDGAVWREPKSWVVGQFAMADFRAGKRAVGAASSENANVRTKVPLVEVTAPDGSKSLWAAAVARTRAVAAVEGVIPANHVAALSQRRLTLTRKSEGLRPGEVRKVKL
jgi:hypothetical protein